MIENIIRDVIDAAAAKPPEQPKENPGAESANTETPTPQMTLEQINARIGELAALSPIEYDQIRENEAKKMKIRVSTLDKEVSRLRPVDTEESGDLIFPVPETWPETVDGGTLLSEIVATIKRFVVCFDETAIAAALWIVMTWFVDVIQVAPLAVITAPEKRAGKSTLLEVFGLLCNRPLQCSNITPSALFRTIEEYRPTLLIDEVDTFARDNDELRGVLNSGHKRGGAFTIRTVGEDHRPKRFNVWGAKALAGIGALPDTIMDRAIKLELRRKKPGETVGRLRHVKPGLFDDLTAKLARFADDNRETMRTARPRLPAFLNDREMDNWEPPLAIADIAGGDWPQMARSAARKISEADNGADSIGCELLADIQEIFEARSINDVSLKDLLRYLCDDDEWPWATYNRGNSITTRQLSKKLRGYGIETKQGWYANGNGKGYEACQFADAFDRYIPKREEADGCSADESDIYLSSNPRIFGNTETMLY